MATIKSLIPARIDLKSLLTGDNKKVPIYKPAELLAPVEGSDPNFLTKLQANRNGFDSKEKYTINDKVLPPTNLDKWQSIAESQNKEADFTGAITPSDISYYNLYNNFLHITLEKFSGLSLNDIWLIDIDFQTVPKNVKSVLDQYESGLYAYDLNDLIKYTFNGKHLLLAQGVSVVGDSGTINRIGTTNTGYIQGNVGMGRTPFNTLDVKILENNTSFVDYVLRPWMVAVSHASLKESGLKANITVVALTRVGGFGATGGINGKATGNGFVARKIYKYNGCVPIDVDNMEFNYTQDAAPTLRNIKFSFNTYTIDTIKNGEGNIFAQIMNSEKQISNVTGRYNTKTNTDKIRPKTDLSEYQKTIHVSEAIIPKGPDKNASGMTDKLLAMGKDAILNSAKGYANIGIGMAQTAVNNTLGAVEGTTLSWIVKGEQTVAKPLNAAVEGLNVAVTGALEKLNPSGRNDDASSHAQNGIGRELGNPSYTNTNIKIPQNDTANVSIVGFDPSNPYKPVFTDTRDSIDIKGVKPEALLSYNAKPYPPIDDVRHGEIIVGGKSIDQNDRPDGLHNLQNLLPNPPDNDHLIGNEPMGNVKPNPDPNDHLIGKEQVGNIKPNPAKDSAPSKTIKFIYIPTPANDVLRSE